MVKIFVDTDNIISPLGFDTKENFKNILAEQTGISIVEDPFLSAVPLPLSLIDGSIVDQKFRRIGDPNKYTRFEKLSILSVKDALDRTKLEIDNNRTLFILSTTKGNIELLGKTHPGIFSKERTKLYNTAKIISEFFLFKSKPVVVSNACISGVAAIIVAQRLIKQGLYDNVVVNGTEVISHFIVSGFQSFHSLSTQPCKPFDLHRDGLTLGEGSATVVMTNKESDIEIREGATSNDANHISGPSRTGEGLFLAITNSIKGDSNIDFISAHGTATRYNDDMESIAISRAGLNHVPVNSLKGYFGHTLGAAGVIESIVCFESMRNNTLVNTKGCEETGVAENINVIRGTQKRNLKTVLKMASGFGGGNAVALFEKYE